MTLKRGPYSLLRRLTFSFSIVAIVVFALTGALLYDSLSTELERRDDIEIGGKLSQFLQLARNSGSTDSIRANQPVFHLVLLSHPGVYLVILDRNGVVLMEHGDEPAIDVESILVHRRADNVPYVCLPGRTGVARCVIGEETLPSGEAIRVIVVRKATDRHSLLDSYRKQIWFAVAFGAALVGTLGYAVANRGLRPVKSIGRQTASIEAHNLSERLDLEEGPVELQEIAVAVNRMLDRLERAFVRLSQFSSDLAHDMRTPLANVISSSQITLSRSRTTDEYEALIDSNIEECERLQRMIENMLFLARTDNAKQGLQVARLDSAKELDRLASYFQGVAEDIGVSIIVNGGATLHADGMMFRRAVSNLVSNALDHARTSSTIELRASQSSKYIAVSVTNQGKPIAPEHLEKIFDRFYRADPSRHGSAKNAGLGLAIVKSIMELHRGRVDVASGEEGTTFTLYFPLCPAV
ncbi:heavy metal sensor histidine kinase [Paraburkholderia fungorum]|uniref:heavy metal sensor histidine kinase n=1 Tax=Paraburkholderia fungorum TaxID=134537 RepID=UPI0033133524